MDYFAPKIDENGFHMPTYASIRDQMLEDARGIFGQDIYLEEDSQDYQWIATVAEKIYDAFQIAEKVYNNRAPNTAVGVGLDSIIKINGLKRQTESFSTCIVTLIGEVNTEVKNGIVVDKGGIKWALPKDIVIPEIGKSIALATCTVPGPIVANPGDIDTIYNPTYGWGAIFNDASAKLGSLTEDDSNLRIRQSRSTAQASLSMFEGTVGSVAQVKGVTRSKAYENDTDEIDELGLPPHSITIVAEGGLTQDVAEAIWHHKGPGCSTYGDVLFRVKDSKDMLTPINFFRPTYVDIEIVVNVKQLDGYTTETTERIKVNLQTYLNSMKIGTGLSMSSLWGVALQAMPNLANPLFSILSITAAKFGEVQEAKDIPFTFKEVCRGNVNNITANVV